MVTKEKKTISSTTCAQKTSKAACQARVAMGSCAPHSAPELYKAAPGAGRSQTPVRTRENPFTHPFMVVLEGSLSATPPATSLTNTVVLQSTSLGSTSSLLNLVTSAKVFRGFRAGQTGAQTHQKHFKLHFLRKRRHGVHGLGWTQSSSHTPELHGQPAEGLQPTPPLCGGTPHRPRLP